MDNDTRLAPEFTLDPREGSLTGPAGTARLEPKVMAVLVVLADHPGHVVLRDELLDAVWPGTIVTENTLTRCVYQLRQELRTLAGRPGDAGFDPLETIPKRGYRLLADVSVSTDEDAPVPVAAPPAGRDRYTRGAVIVVTAVAAAVIFYFLYTRAIDPPVRLASGNAAIAVLPFDNRSPDPENAYFADGVHDDLLMLLSRLSDLKVVSRTSVETFRDSTETVPEIGRALGVDHVLEGAVQRVDDRVRISVQLIHVATDDHVWAEAYDRRLTATDIFAIQSDVATAIATALQATLSLREQKQLLAVPTENLAAYESFLMGKQRLARRTSASVTMATDLFQQAIALDPDFALAYIGLADSLNMQVVYGGAPRESMNARAEAAIDTALEIDAELGEAYASLGWLRHTRDDLDGAETAFLRALQLTPSYVTAYHWYGNLLRRLGRTEDALALHLRGVELDPVSAGMNLHVGNDLESLGRFDEAMDWYRKTIDIDPSFSVAYATIADVHWLVHGDLDQAVPWYHKALELDPLNPVTLAWLGRLYLDLRDEARAEYWIRRSIEVSPTSIDGNYSMFALNLYRGNATQALHYADKVLEISPLWFSPVLAALRDHDLQAGRLREARARYEQFHANLLSDTDPVINRSNYWPAIDLALVLKKTGEHERANSLLAGSFDVVRSVPRLGIHGHGISDVRIHALRDRPNLALAALRQAIDDGWRHRWWHCIEQDPALDSIRDTPQFQGMMAEIRADIAAQQLRVGQLDAGALQR